MHPGSTGSTATWADEREVSELPRKNTRKDGVTDASGSTLPGGTPENATGSENGHGLFLAGEVSDRVKKSVTAQGVEVEVVTYSITCRDGQRHYVDDFDPEKYYNIGETVCLPVYVKTYRKKSGEPSYMLKLLKKNSFIASRGERF